MCGSRWPSRFRLGPCSKEIRATPLSCHALGELATTDSVEHMTALRPVGQERVIEIRVDVVHHAELLHHTPRVDVVHGGEADDLIAGQIDARKAPFQCGDRRFRGEAVAPMLLAKPPADLDTGRERGLPRSARRDRRTR